VRALQGKRVRVRGWGRRCLRVCWRGRELSAEDKAHYAKIVVALKETIRLMAEMDGAILGWPLE
jgi:hypothetical protein